jgi:hypothetical protein
MRARISVMVSGLAAIAFVAAVTGVRAFDETKYPNWRGQWSAPLAYQFGTNPSWDQTKAQGLAQEAPLTPEYQTLHEASLADVAAGGHGLDRDFLCITPGMPRMMNVYSTLEILVFPDTTYMLLGFVNDIRRIYTDGREWPAEIEPTYAGYSIGKWIDSDGDGRCDVLEVETPRVQGAAHTRQHRNPQARPLWREAECVENNAHIRIGNQNYMLSGDGLLMPAKKDQSSPNLRYFNRSSP